MLVVGIVGGIGAGKTEVLRLLAAHGAAAVAADELNREALAPGQPTLATIREAFGDGYFDEQGGLRRQRLGDLIFGDAAARDRLERLVHPVMCRLLGERLAQWRQAGVAVAAVEAAVLERMGALDLVDRVLLVTAPAEQRVRRLTQRDGLSAAQAAARLRSQEQLGLDRPRADYVIVNDGELSDLARKVELFWTTLV